MEDTKFSIINKTKGKLPSLPFVQIKNDILGINYSLSVAYVGEKKSKELNLQYRQKNKSTNILSFSLDKNNGEIILCPSVIKKQAPDFDRNFKNFLGFLVIHGMLHLKGYEHSSTMDKLEQKYDQKYFSRNRLGHINDESNRRRIHQRRK
jgi:rRNA maturation RNase YbeY